MRVSVVVPCYNEEEALVAFFPAISSVFARVADEYSAEYELVFVDDGSSDGTLGMLRGYAKQYDWVHYLSFSRNFGKESAIYAGLSRATGDLVALMDADMQDPPELLPKMLAAIIKEGYDSVATRRVTRKGEPVVRSFFARLFYRIVNHFSETEIMDGARDFRLMKRVMVNAILSMGEYNRFSKGIFGWVGFKTKWLPYENVERVAGTTKWSFWKLFSYAIQGIMAFSTAPLAIASVIGVFFCLLAFAGTIWIVFRTLLYGDPVSGWPSLACIISFIGGVQLFSIGVLGQYLAKSYLEVKKRPIYIVAESDMG